MTAITYAEINSCNNAVRHTGQAPFLPVFEAGSGVYCVDITRLDPQPDIGKIYDPDTGTFSAPPPPSDPNAAYMGMLTLQSVAGGTFDNNSAPTELNCNVNTLVTVQGNIMTLDGSAVEPVNFLQLRLPLVPTDLEGNTIEGTRPSMAAASINKGEVIATWTPEFTGTYAITEEALNVRLPHGAKLRFAGLQIFVLPRES